MVLGVPSMAAWAAPLAAPEDRQQLQVISPGPADAAESPVDVQGWIQREATVALLDGAFEADRRAVLNQSWQGRAATWIQDSSAVNLGDFPTLDNSVERAERDLKTLEWVLEEQHRVAAGQPSPEDRSRDATPQDNLLRSLLPTQWVAALKANREWVAAGGTALLVIVWGTTIFARRPTAGPVEAPAAPQPPKPRRRRRRYRDTSSIAG